MTIDMTTDEDAGEIAATMVEFFGGNTADALASAQRSAGAGLMSRKVADVLAAWLADEAPMESTPYTGDAAYVFDN